MELPDLSRRGALKLAGGGAVSGLLSVFKSAPKTAPGLIGGTGDFLGEVAKLPPGDFLERLKKPWFWVQRFNKRSWYASRDANLDADLASLKSMRPWAKALIQEKRNDQRELWSETVAKLFP